MIPYREIAEQAIKEWYLSLGPDAHELATTEDISRLENGIDGKMYGVGAEPSINSGINGIIDHLSKLGIELPDGVAQSLKDAVMTGKDSNSAEIYGVVENALNQVQDKEEVILDALTTTHNDWVERSSTEKTFNKKIDKAQLYQYSELELIGWDEASKDLLFLEPILRACGMEINLENLQEAYNQRVVKFCEEKEIRSQEDLKKYVLSGEYEALNRTKYGKEIVEIFQQNEDVQNSFVETIEEKGIGDISQFIAEHKETITPADIESATRDVTRNGMKDQTDTIRREVTNKQKQIESSYTKE